jgi:hypothetical protein
LPNLRTLVVDVSDVRAPALISAERFGLPFRSETFTRPPMVRAGLEAVIQTAAGPRTQIIRPGSFLTPPGFASRRLSIHHGQRGRR